MIRQLDGGTGPSNLASSGSCDEFFGCSRKTSCEFRCCPSYCLTERIDDKQASITKKNRYVSPFTWRTQYLVCCISSFVIGLLPKFHIWHLTPISCLPCTFGRDWSIMKCTLVEEASRPTLSAESHLPSKGFSWNPTSGTLPQCPTTPVNLIAIGL